MDTKIFNEVLFMENGFLTIENESKDIWIECMNMEFTEIINEDDEAETVTPPSTSTEEKPEDKSKVKAILEKIKGWFVKAWNWISTNVPKFFKTMGAKIANFFTGKDKPVKIKVVKGHKIIIDACKTISAELKKGEEANQEVIDKAKETINNVKAKEEVEEIDGSAFKAIGVFFQNIFNICRAAVTKALTNFKAKFSRVKSTQDTAEAASAQKSAGKDVKTCKEGLGIFSKMFSIFKPKKEEDTEEKASAEEN